MHAAQRVARVGDGTREAVHARRPEVLLFGHDEGDRVLFARVLSLAGYGARHARCELEALALASRRGCDLVLLGVATTEAMRTLRALKAIGTVPVIAIVSDPLMEASAAVAGAALCLSRPLGVSRLPWRIGSVLRRRRRSFGDATTLSGAQV